MAHSRSTYATQSHSTYATHSRSTYAKLGDDIAANVILRRNGRNTAVFTRPLVFRGLLSRAFLALALSHWAVFAQQRSERALPSASDPHRTASGAGGIMAQRSIRPNMGHPAHELAAILLYAKRLWNNK
jgi:hypothetical protein